MSPSAEDSNPPPLRAPVLRATLALYTRLLSPILHAMSGSTGACRFQPTCSEYAALAVETHGLVRGAILALGRLARCHPFHPPAYDPVPPKKPAAPVEPDPCPPSTLPRRQLP